MATITNTLTITSAAGDALSDALSLSFTKADSAIAGDVEMKLVTVDVRFTTVAANMIELLGLPSTTGRALVYLKNTSSTEAQVVSVFTNTGDDVALVEDEEKIMILKAGDFALFPWAGEHALLASSAAGDPKVEVGVFFEA